MTNDLAVPYEVLTGEFLRLNITCPDYSGCLPFKIGGGSNQTTGKYCLHNAMRIGSVSCVRYLEIVCDTSKALSCLYPLLHLKEIQTYHVYMNITQYTRVHDIMHIYGSGVQ